MEIIVRELGVKNFKGFKEKTIKFNEEITKIIGANETGKTSINDAFKYILFDKNSNYESNFDIKPQDENGQEIHRLNTEVEAKLEVDGQFINLKKVYHERWTRPKGAKDEELTGHTTDYFLNGVPVKKKVYDEKINSFMDEDIFKILTDPFYFSEEMNWKDRRKILEEIAGDIDNTLIAGDDYTFNKLLKNLENEKTLEGYRKEIKHAITGLKKEKKDIPPRIDELNNSIKEMRATREVYEADIKAMEKKIEKTEDKIENSSNIYKENEEYNAKIFSLKTQLSKIENEFAEESGKERRNIESKIQELKHSIDYKETDIKNNKEKLAQKRKLIKEYETIADNLRAEFKAVQGDMELKIETDCPTCGQMLPPGEIEKRKADMIARHNKNVAAEKEKIRAQGKDYATKIEKLKETEVELEKKIERAGDTLTELENELKVKENELKGAAVEKEFAPGPKYKEIKAKISALEEKLQTPNKALIDKLKAYKSEIRKDIKETEKHINQIEVNEKTKKRIDELLKKEESLSQLITEYEGIEFAAEEFERKRAGYIEDIINSKFDERVQFRLFENLVNGGLNEVCRPLVKNDKGILVPFRGTNNAGKINAGIEIINVLSEHYDFRAPIFIDNAESVNNIKKSKSQKVELYVAETGTPLQKVNSFEDKLDKAIGQIKMEV